MCFEHEMNKAFFKAYMFTGWIIQIQGVPSQKEHFPSKLIRALSNEIVRLNATYRIQLKHFQTEHPVNDVYICSSKSNEPCT